MTYHTYWFNAQTGEVFCLVEAPDKAAANRVHRAAQGLVADDLVEVQADTGPLHRSPGQRWPAITSRPWWPESEQRRPFPALCFASGWPGSRRKVRAERGAGAWSAGGGQPVHDAHRPERSSRSLPLGVPFGEASRSRR